MKGLFSLVGLLLLLGPIVWWSMHSMTPPTAVSVDQEASSSEGNFITGSLDKARQAKEQLEAHNPTARELNGR